MKDWLKSTITFFVTLGILFGIKISIQALENFFYQQIGKPFEEIGFVQFPETRKPPLSLEVKSALSLKIDPRGKERIMFQKNPQEILPIASLTKLMTALVVTTNEKVYPKEKIITISLKAANQKDVPVYGNLKKGEKYSVEELLEMALIYSSNDAAYALAEVIGLEEFIKEMNRIAKEIDLKDTHFVNPTGLEPEDLKFNLTTKEEFNYSTARDLIKLAQYIFSEHPSIFEISKRKGPYLVRNGLSELVLPANFEFLGGKTGYTEEAGECLLVAAKNEKGSIFFNVILGAPKGKRIKEMEKLINWLNL